MQNNFSSQLNTVLTLAEYFDELQASAHELTANLPSEEDGVFRPEQESQVARLLIGYWHSRNALFEQLYAIRHDNRLYESGGEVLFLMGYASALLLIDAASFLRDSAKDRPILRHKLNEENREFGIPANVYNTVQRSLASTRTAWHLYHAITCFREHETRLRALASDDETTHRLLEVIDQRNYRLDRPLTQLQSARLRIRARNIASRSSQSLYRSLYGIQKLGGIALADRYLKRGHQPGLPEPVSREIVQTLQPGDVLAVRKEFAVTNYFLPGYWPHVALYLGDSDHPQVLESKKDGVLVRSVGSPFASDSIVVLRPRLAAPSIAQALDRGMKHAGKRYDFSFDFSRSDRLVCTEVVYRSYDGIEGISFPLVKRAGRMTLSGNDLIEMSLAAEVFDPVLVYAPMFESEVFREISAVKNMVERCMRAEPLPFNENA